MVFRCYFRISVPFATYFASISIFVILFKKRTVFPSIVCVLIAASAGNADSAKSEQILLMVNVTKLTNSGKNTVKC